MSLRQNAGYSVDAMGLARYVSYYGPMAEWLCSGLQNRVHRFNSGSGLHLPLYFDLTALSARRLVRSIRLTSVGQALAFQFIEMLRYILSHLYARSAASGIPRPLP